MANLFLASPLSANTTQLPTRVFNNPASCQVNAAHVQMGSKLNSRTSSTIFLGDVGSHVSI
jgi:hypothetical protein